jgi:hypothetical protein
MLKRRRKVIADWAAFLAGESDERTAVPFKGTRLAPTQEGST